MKLIRHSWPHTSSPVTDKVNEHAARAAIVFADPPYNIGVRYDDDPSCDSLSSENYRRLTGNVLRAMRRCMKPNATLWWMVPEHHADWVGTMLSDIIGPRVHRIVWHETFAQYQQKLLTEDYRFIFCHTNGNPKAVTFNPDDIRVESRRQELGDNRADPRGRVPGQVWQVRRLQGTAIDRVEWHPTQLPPELLDRIIKGWSNPGDLVIDPFVGSGKTLSSCLRNNRDFVGFDQSGKYIEKCQEILEKHK